MKPVELALFAVGYPASITVITRWIPVVRERRWRWLVAHHIGVTAIIAGWVLRRELPAIAVNSGWLVASSAWYALGGGRGPERPPERDGER